MIRFSGAFEPLVGIPLINRLEAEADRIAREARRAGSPEPREAYAADALAKMLSGQGRGGNRRADVVIVCDLRAYRRGHAEEGETCHLGGGPVPASAARQAAQDDAFIKAVVHDGVHEWAIMRVSLTGPGVRRRQAGLPGPVRPRGQSEPGTPGRRGVS
ncbi:MAG TPA: hypothetical protein VM142_01725 [Acidimicrobiales bacterium]|nr:hypothetical protein [Acidimicrobiales bacterium]